MPWLATAWKLTHDQSAGFRLQCGLKPIWIIVLAGNLISRAVCRHAELLLRK